MTSANHPRCVRGFVVAAHWTRSVNTLLKSRKGFNILLVDVLSKAESEEAPKLGERYIYNLGGG
jgi:hypothetical protein